MNVASGHFFIYTFGKAPGTLSRLSLYLLTVLFFWGHEIYAQDVDDLLHTAEDFYEKEQYHKAAQYYQVAVGLQDDLAEATYHLAESYRAVFDYPLAAVYYEKTMDLDAYSYPLAGFYLAQMHKFTGNFNLAINAFRRFMDDHSNSPLIETSERETFIEQAGIEVEGCLWALEQLQRPWKEIGFVNLPPPVNTTYNDYAAVPEQNDTTITFTSGRREAKGDLVDNRFGDYFTDNFRYTKTNDTWEEVRRPDRFDRANTKFSDGVGAFNARGDKFYFTSCYEENAYCKLYVMQMVKGQWKAPRILNNNINTGDYDNRHPTLTPGGDTLIFVSNRPGGQGGNDLWFSVAHSDEDWGSPQPLPSHINTPFQETAPFYHPNGILFFGSNGHKGLGGMDIMMIEDIWNPQSEIVNLGIPFNSGYDDSFIALGTGLGYLSSNRAGGQGKFDIYQFVLPVPAKNLRQFLEERGEGLVLRSRVRSNDLSNLVAVRDEDQFYYDNLTAEERAAIDRILAARKTNESTFDPSSLSSEDLKYYRKLDIAAKATIERLAQRKARRLDGLTPEQQMTGLEREDWEFYQEVEETEKAIIDRIIDAKIESRKQLLSQLSSEQRAYLTDSPQARDRIETKAQIQNLDSLAKGLENAHADAQSRLVGNEAHLQRTADQMIEDPLIRTLSEKQKDRYQRTIDELPLDHQVVYQQLTPEGRDNIHKSALRSYLQRQPSLSAGERSTILQDLGLTVDPWNDSSHEQNLNDEQRGQVREIIARLAQQMLQPPPDLNVPERERYHNLTLAEKAAVELLSQQAALEAEIAKNTRHQDQLSELRTELQQSLSTDEQEMDPSIEQRLVERLASHDREFITKVSPREAFYFQSVEPSAKLRLDRLAFSAERTTENLSKIRDPRLDFLNGVPAADRLFFENLTPQDKESVLSIVAQGLNPDQPLGAGEQAFFQGLSALDRARIQRMVYADRGGNYGILADVKEGQPATVQGRIRPSDPAQVSAGVPLAVVDADGNRVATATTDPDGRFVFQGVRLENGMKIVSLDQQGQTTPLNYEIENLEIDYDQIPADEAGTVVRLTDPLKEGEEAEVRGRFLPDDPSIPVAGVTMALLDADGNQMNTGITNREGNFILRGVRLEEGMRVVALDHQGRRADMNYEISALDIIYGKAQTDETGTTVHLPDPGMEGKQATLSGKLRSSDPLQSAAGVTVVLLDAQGNRLGVGTTSNDGSFIFQGVDLQKEMRVVPLESITDPGSSPYFIEDIDWLIEEPRRDETGRLVEDVESEERTPAEEAQVGEPKITAGEPLTGGRLADASQVYFDFDRSSLRSEAREILDELVRQLDQQPGMPTVVIEGHTDNVGPRNYNRSLSERRSAAVNDFISSATDRLRTDTRSMGEERPVASNLTAAGRQINRRVDVKVEGADFRPSMHLYLVKPGVRLSEIAAASGYAETQIMHWNGWRSKVLRAYQPLRLPVDLNYQHISRWVYDPQRMDQTATGARFHQVQYGETLFGLARKYQTTVQSLEQLNGIEASDLKAGQKLRIR